MELESTAPGGTASAVRFTIESASTSSSINQRIFLFNYRTGVWDEVDSRATTVTDSVAEINVTLTSSDYVNPTTNAMRARITYRATGPVLAFPWNARVDLARWVITP
jgi:hypothetical protein